MFRRLLDLTRDQRLLLPLTILTGWLTGLAAIGQAWYLSGAVEAAFLGDKTLTEAVPLLTAAGITILVRAAAQAASENSANALALRIKSSLRKRLLAHISRLGPAAARGESSGELATSAVEGIEALDAWFSQYLPQAALAAILPLAVLAVVFPIDPLTGAVFLVTAPLIPFFMYLIGATAEKLTARQWETLRRLSTTLLDVVQGLATLKALGQARRGEERVRNDAERFRDLTLGVLRVAFLSALALELLATISTAIVAVEIGLRLLNGGIGFHQALFILIIAPDFYLPMRMLGLRFHAGMSGMQAARRIFEILDTPLPAAEQGGKPMPGRFNIRFEGVSCAYTGRSLPALEEVSFTIAHGQTTALVGASGAGKSTVANLLLRFLSPQAGTIRVDGIPLADLPAEDWRRLIAWVPQQTHIFHDTLAANLRLARPGASEAQMLHACRQAGLEEFIARLPQGLETPAGEEGARLSGGQAQRLALARAFLREAPFLLLDEPTSSLDPRLEADLTESVEELMGGRTVLVIAHRLNTVRRAEQIIVLEAGRVVECGRHEQLLAQGGVYSRLVRPQMEAQQ